jgi:uncharacterized protein (TIGR03663 family)
MTEELKSIDKCDSLKSEISFRVNWQSILWTSLFLFVIITRFHHLGDKPFHHDESLYAKYIWNFHVGMGYQYDPMQHGPFMFHMQQISLFLFGVTNYTMRILPASTGIFLMVLMFMIRKYLPSGVALLAGWLFAINPVFMYFQRFNREDPYYSLLAVAIFAFMLMWYRDKKPWQFYASAAAVSSLFCTKENAFVNVFIFFTFALLKVVVEMFEKNGNRRMGFKSISENIHSYPISAKTTLFVTLWGISFIIYALANQFLKSRFPNWNLAVNSYWIIVFLIMAGFAGFQVAWGERHRSGELTKKTFGLNPVFFADSHIFAVGVLIFVAIFITLYTTFFTNMKGFWGGIYEWYTYWLHQHSIARIRGPFHYYHHLMLIYSFIALSVVLIGSIWRSINKAGMFKSVVFIIIFMLGLIAATKSKQPWPLTKEDLFTNEHLILALGFLVAGTYCTITYIKEKILLRAVLIWWSLISYLIYSYLQEKVPWLVMHIITPMILMAALMLMDIFKDRSLGWRRTALISLFSLMIIYCFHTSIQVCWYHEADPTEQLVYVQTTYEVPKMIEEMERIGFWTNQGNEIAVNVDGDATWPFYWYLRDWKSITYGKAVDPSKHLVVICNWADRFTFKEKLGDKYVARKYGLRAWYLPKRTDFTPGKWIQEAFRWVLLRERFKPSLYGTQDVCMFVRNDVAELEWSTDLGDKPVAPKKKEAPATASPLNPRNLLEFGRFGSGPGQFNEPKDLTVDKSGNIFVADNKNDRIEKFGPDGKFISSWGSAGKGDGQFDKPTGIGLDSSGNVYVADTWNHRIQKFDSNGKYISQFGDSNLFWAPKDVVVDDEGFIYVVNTGFHRIQKFTRNGQQVWAVGTKGSDANQFTEPVGMEIDSIGRIFVADTANQRICLYDKDGHFLKNFQVYGWEDYYSEPFIAIDKSNNTLYTTDSKQGRIELFDLEGNFKNYIGKDGSENGEFKSPKGVVIVNNKLYVSDSLNHRIQIFDTQNH